MFDFSEKEIFSDMKMTVLFIMALSSILFARMSCSTNSFGVTVCTDEKGYRSETRTNSFGVTTTTDNRGRRYESRTNSFGVTTTTGNNGYRQSCRTNSFGTTICD